MCLSAPTSRKPLFTTAYKILYKGRYGYETPFRFQRVYPEYKNWIHTGGPEINLYYDDIKELCLAEYLSGFHSYINLSDAILVTNSLKSINQYYQLYHVFEVDTADIVQYGVERGANRRSYDVVVSKRIKFIQQII